MGIMTSKKPSPITVEASEGHKTGWSTSTDSSLSDVDPTFDGQPVAKKLRGQESDRNEERLNRSSSPIRVKMEPTAPGIVPLKHKGEVLVIDLDDKEYELLEENLYCGSVNPEDLRKRDDEEELWCKCSAPTMNEEGCGEDCDNRGRRVECKKDYCRAGDECSNMSISKKTPDKVRMDQDVLVATERVRGGRYLAQYTGEVVTRKEMEDRVRSEYWPGQILHVLPLGTSAVVDATNKGGICRLASHSCSPNTEVVTWMVELDGEPRLCLAMYSLREIQEGESLSYDYSPQMELLKTRKPCNCGAKNCKKMLGASVSIMGPVQCTACQVMVLEDGVKKEVCLHPTLALPVCKSCKVKVELADWRKEQICRWCTRTDQVIVSCSTCQSNFCRKCLNSNLGPGYIKLVKSSLDNWTCLLCDSSPLDKPRSRLVSPQNKSEINPRKPKLRQQTIRPVRPITHRMTPGSTLSRGRPPTSRLLGRGAVSLRSIPAPSPSLLQPVPVRDEQTSRLLSYLQTRGINIQPVSHQVEIMHSVAEELEAAEIILHGIVSEARRQTTDGESSISKTKERVLEAIKNARVKLGQAEQKLC